MAEDFAKTFRVLKSLPCDVFLGPHRTRQFGLAEKAGRLRAGESPNPFIDPAGYRKFVARSEEIFLRQWDREQARAHPGANPRILDRFRPPRSTHCPMWIRKAKDIDGNDQCLRGHAADAGQVGRAGAVLLGRREGMRRGPVALGRAGLQVRLASFSAIDLLRSVMLTQALRDGFDSFLFIDADIGFNPGTRSAPGPAEPAVAGICMKKNARDYSGVFAAGVDRVVFGPGAAGV